MNADSDSTTTGGNAWQRQRIASEIFQSEETLWRAELDRIMARIQALTDAVGKRQAELRLRYVDNDPALARRFEDFRAANADAGKFLQDALGMAWEDVRTSLRAAAGRLLMAPGEPAPASGQYEIVDSEGRGTGEERTAIQGRPLPPTPAEGQTYRLVDSTRNDAGVLEER